MSALHLAAFEKDGLLPESDFNKISRAAEAALKGIRIPAVRHSLDFVSHTFDQYETHAKESFDKSHMPAVDPEFAFEFNTIPLTFAAKFGLSFFPDFNREYFTPRILDRMIVCSDDDGYTIVPIGDFRSLVVAGHQLRTVAKQRLEKLGQLKQLEITGLEIETEFLIPSLQMVDDISHEMTVHLTAFLLFDN